MEVLAPTNSTNTFLKTVRILYQAPPILKTAPMQASRTGEGGSSN